MDIKLRHPLYQVPDLIYLNQLAPICLQVLFRGILICRHIWMEPMVFLISAEFSSLKAKCTLDTWKLWVVAL